MGGDLRELLGDTKGDTLKAETPARVSVRIAGADEANLKRTEKR